MGPNLILTSSGLEAYDSKKPQTETQDIFEYSSHDWRKHTDDAIVVAAKPQILWSDSLLGIKLKVNDSRVIFTNPHSLKTEEVEVSRLIRVFVNNREGHKRSVK